MELAEVEQILNSYLRPATFPVAVKMIGAADEVPERAILPWSNWATKITVCQAIALARRHGLLIALNQDDMYCPAAGLILGLLPAREKILDATFPVPFPFWVESQSIRDKLVRNMPRLEYGKYTYLVAAPIHQANFEPDVIIIYGNPAQIARLIQAYVYSTGEIVRAENMGSLACGDLITKPMLTDRCHFSMIGGGERIIAQAHDDEAAFAIPVSKVETVVKGLKSSHEAGMRYPTPSYLKFSPVFTEFTTGIDELAEYLRQNRK